MVSAGIIKQLTTFESSASLSFLVLLSIATLSAADTNSCLFLFSLLFGVNFYIISTVSFIMPYTATSNMPDLLVVLAETTSNNHSVGKMCARAF